MTGIPKRLINYLNDNQVQYEVLHRPEISNDSEAMEVENRMGRFHAKVVIVKAGHQPVVTVFPLRNSIDLKGLGKFVGESVRLETEEEFKWLFPDCAVDAIPPFGNLYGLPTFADSKLSKNGYITFTAGTPCDYIKLSYRAYERIVHPRIAAFSVKSRSRSSE
jgi:Ala-tRNA(Pro) deacylase